MDQQIALIQEAFGRARGARLGGAPLDISVSRQFGEATVTLRTQLGGGGGPPALSSGTKRDSTGADVAGRQPSLDERMSGSTEDGGAVPAAPPLRNRNVSFWSDGSAPEAGGGGDAAMAEDSVAGIVRRTSTGGFYEDPSEVVRLTAEIERLKRKALSRGVNLTSKDEQVPAEDVAMLKQIFGLADSTGDGFIDEEELIAMHQVLGEPMTPSEATSAFKAMDMNESGNISFDDFLSWYTLAHSRSGMLSKKGQATGCHCNHHHHHRLLRHHCHLQLTSSTHPLPAGVHRALQEDHEQDRGLVRPQAPHHHHHRQAEVARLPRPVPLQRQGAAQADLAVARRATLPRAILRNSAQLF